MAARKDAIQQSDPDVRTKHRNEWRGAWKVTTGVTLAMATGVGLYNTTAGFFVKPLEAEFGWSRGAIAVGSAAGALAAIMMPIAGILVDRYGVKRVGATAMAAFAISLLALSLLPGHLWVFYALLAGVAVAAPGTSGVVFTRPIVAAFNRSRGAALGVTMSGAALLGIVAQPALQQVLDHLGWRAGYVLIGALPLLIGLPAVLWLLPGHSRTPGAQNKRMTSTDGVALSLREAMRGRCFWLLALAMLTANVPVGGLMNQLQAMLNDKGIPGPTAALLGSLLSASVIGGRVLVGALIDRFWPPAVASLSLLIPIAGALLMASSAPAVPAAAVGVVLFGLAQGAEADFLAFFTARYFGLKSYGLIFGSLVVAVSVALAGGAVLFGALYDATGGYELALVCGSVCLFVGAMCLLWAGREPDAGARL